MTNHDQRIGWGVISTGHIASVFSRDLALLPDEARLVGVASRDLGRAETFAAEHGFEHAYATPAGLAADPDVDVVYVASIHNDHLTSARACIEAGKAVLVEKPLTVSTEDTEELIRLARASGVFLMEAVWMRTNPLIRRAIELVRAGGIGHVRHINAQFAFAFDGPDDHRLLDPEQAGGAILDLGLYPAHAVEAFLGEPAALTAYGSLARTEVDAHTAALAHYPATGSRPAATAAMFCSLEVDVPTSLAVYGSTGRIVIDDLFFRPEQVRVERPGVEPEVWPGSWPGGGYTFEAQEVMRCLLAGELESPTVPWAATLSVARMLDTWRARVRDTVHEPTDNAEGREADR